LIDIEGKDFGGFGIDSPAAKKKPRITGASDSIEDRY